MKKCRKNKDFVSAEKLLQSLGYEKINRYEYFLEYRNGNQYISFNLSKRTVSSYEECMNTFIHRELTMTELKAVIMMCKELRWKI